MQVALLTDLVGSIVLGRKRAGSCLACPMQVALLIDLVGGIVLGHKRADSCLAY